MPALLEVSGLPVPSSSVHIPFIWGHQLSGSHETPEEQRQNCALHEEVDKNLSESWVSQTLFLPWIIWSGWLPGTFIRCSFRVDAASVPGVLVGRGALKLHFAVSVGGTLKISLHPRVSHQGDSHTHKPPEHHQLMLNKTTCPHHTGTAAMAEVTQ